MKGQQIFCDEMKLFWDEVRLREFIDLFIDLQDKDLVVDAVAVAGRLTGDDDADRSGAAVDGLMGLAGGDLDSLSWVEGEVVMFDLDGEFALEDVEELAGTGVVVAGFAGAWGH